jgi:drug/metabolite transporter (DMT)-like permease
MISPFKRFLLILALTCMWSPSFLFIKLALEDFSPAATVFLRVALASFIFWITLRIQGGSLPKDGKFWMHSAFMAIFSSGLPFFLFCYAETSIESALAAILNGSTPMFTAMMAHLFLPNDKLSLNKTLGIFFSFAGVLLLFSPNIAQGMDGDFLGMLAALIAAFSYAISHVYAKKYTAGHARFVAPTAQLIISALIMLPFAIGFSESSTSLKTPSLVGISGVLGLSLLGTYMAFMIYYYLMEHCGPTAISMVACFFPVIGMFLGYLFLGESLTVAGLFSAGLILIGMLTVNEVISFSRAQPKITPETSS